MKPEPTVEEIVRAMKTLNLSGMDISYRILNDFVTSGITAATSHLKWVDCLLAAHDAGRYEHGKENQK